MSQAEAREISINEAELTQAVVGTPYEGGSEAFGLLTVITSIIKPNPASRILMGRIPYPPHTLFRDVSYPKEEGICVPLEVVNRLGREFMERYKDDWEYVAMLELEEDVDDPSIILKGIPERLGVYTVRAFHGLEIPNELEYLVQQRIQERRFFED